MLCLVVVLAVSAQIAPDSPQSVARAFALINAERSRHGLQPYRPNVALGIAAESQARAQASRGRMGHDGGGGPFARIKRAGYAGRAGGENVGWNQQTSEQIISGWMHSPGHRAAILSRTYVDCGIACEMGRNGPYWCGTFGAP